MNTMTSRKGEYHTLFPGLRSNPDKFKKYLRMDIPTFDYLLRRTTRFLIKNWCNLHIRPVYPEERLVLTLRFLATGSSYTHLSFSFMIGISTVSTIVFETMQIIWDVLSPIHMAIPNTADFMKIAKNFDDRWGFPNCLGAVDGRHVRIKKPPHSGSKYFNYKKYFSIVLQAVVDSKYRYLFIDVGGYGRQNDAQTFYASDFYKCLIKKKLSIPRDNYLPRSSVKTPHVFVTDGAYPRLRNTVKPYPGRNLTKAQRRYNQRLSRARAVVENAFGLTSQKWRIFYTTINKPVEVIELIVKTTCVLHNLIIDAGKETSPTLSSKDVNIESCFAPLLSQDDSFDDSEDDCSSSKIDKEVREKFLNHFSQ